MISPVPMSSISERHHSCVSNFNVGSLELIYSVYFESSVEKWIDIMIFRPLQVLKICVVKQRYCASKIRTWKQVSESAVFIYKLTCYVWRHSYRLFGKSDIANHLSISIQHSNLWNLNCWIHLELVLNQIKSLFEINPLKQWLLY